MWSFRYVNEKVVMYFDFKFDMAIVTTCNFGLLQILIYFSAFNVFCFVCFAFRRVVYSVVDCLVGLPLQPWCCAQ